VLDRALVSPPLAVRSFSVIEAVAEHNLTGGMIDKALSDHPMRVVGVEWNQESDVASKSRVDPWGREFESSERGYFMGNRDFGDAWITGSLRHPDGSVGPGNVGHKRLFFLDEATALAASHRPCGQCRRKDYDVFKRLWAAASDAAMDPTLRAEFEAAADAGIGRATRRAEQLPPGALLEVDGDAYLAWQRMAYRWSAGGYRAARLLKDFGTVRVLTSPSTEHVLEAGYRPWVHPSVWRA
jgi:hypothetical protein